MTNPTLNEHPLFKELTERFPELNWEVTPSADRGVIYFRGNPKTLKTIPFNEIVIIENLKDQPHRYICIAYALNRHNGCRLDPVFQTGSIILTFLSQLEDWYEIAVEHQTTQKGQND